MVGKNCLGPRARMAVMAAVAGCGWLGCVEAVESAEAAAIEAKTQAESRKDVAVQSAKTEGKAPAGVNVAGLMWFTDYYEAYRAAAESGCMMLVYVTPCSPCSQQQNAEQWMAGDAKLHAKLGTVVRLCVPANAMIDVEGQSRRLLSFGSFSHLSGGPGFVVIDLAHREAPYYGHAVSVLPFASGKYYHWRGDYLQTVLDLPPGTLSQRSMIWAVRVHPERPQSTWGEFNPALASGATQQASYQANVQQQGHQNFDVRFASLTSASGGAGVSEVCAESWPGQSLIDSCLDCVASWRQSSGHWKGVSGSHRAYGYDIRQGGNGIWYGTGIFAD